MSDLVKDFLASHPHVVGAFAVPLIMYVVSVILAPSFDYENKHVMVTGGSSGIGLEAAKEYLRRGAHVTIVARTKSKLDIAVKELRSLLPDSSNQKVMSVSVDTGSSQEIVSAALAPAVDKMGSVDVLVNCAGTSIAGEFDALDSKDFERMLRVNVLGSIYPTRAVVGGMKANCPQRGGGRVVFVASQVAQVAIHGYTAYAASKWAIRGLAEALQMELKPYGIYVSVTYPPDTDTPGYEVEMETKPSLTKKLSESGSVFLPNEVAVDMINQSTIGYFGISTGLDGWLLKQLHPGMSPVNNLWEVLQQILFAPISRVIAVFYLLSWDSMCKAEVRDQETKKNK